VVVHQDEALSGGLHNAAEFLFAFSQFLLGEPARSDIDHDALVVDLAALFVADDGGPVFHPAHLAAAVTKR